MKRFFIPTLSNNPRALFAELDNFYKSCQCSSSNSENSSLLPDYRMHEEQGGTYNIELDLPGVADKDIDIAVKDNILTVSATRKRETKDEKGEIAEKVVAKYERSFTLSDKIDTENIAAITRDGMLLLSLPMIEEKNTIKKIEVNKHLEAEQASQDDQK